MLMGFFDKVVKEEEGLSHVITKTGKRRTLIGISKACVFPTSTSPTWHLRLFMGDYLKRMNLHPQGPEADRCPEGHMDQPRKHAIHCCMAYRIPGQVRNDAFHRPTG